MLKYLPTLLLVLSTGLSSAVAETPRRVAWFGTIKQGLAVAKTANRPILLISAAPHCRGVSGIW